MSSTLIHYAMDHSSLSFLHTVTSHSDREGTIHHAVFLMAPFQYTCAAVSELVTGISMGIIFINLSPVLI